MTQVVNRTVTIKARPSTVWRTLTDPELIKQWMAEPEMAIEIITDWKVGSTIAVKGFHHISFENKGTVLRFEPNSILQYSHLSSLSRLPDKPENYSVIEFRLTPREENSTSLTVEITNFPTESIFRHIDFYWRVTIDVIKRFVEDFQEAPAR